MLYVLIILGVSGNPGIFMYKDLEDCLVQKEIAVKHKKDAHCVRWDEPATTVPNLKK